MCYQLRKGGSWDMGVRTFKPGKMMDTRKVGFLESMFYRCEQFFQFLWSGA